MAEIRFMNQGLFGFQDAPPSSDGERFAGQMLLNDWDDIKDRADWCLENLWETGNLLLEMEDSRLLREALNSFIFGNFVSTILCSASAMERLCADRLCALGCDGVEQKTLGPMLRLARRHRILDEHVLDRIQHINSVRLNFAHEKGPDHPYRLFKRTLAGFTPDYQIMLLGDAKEAICLAYAMAAILKRSFPLTFKTPIKS